MFKRLIPLVVLALGGVGFLYLKLTAPTPVEVTAEERSWRVQTLGVELKANVPVVPLYGSIVAPDLLTVTAPLSARVAERPVEEGQRVAEGELLVALDEADYLPAVAQARAEVADLEAQGESERIRFANDQEAQERENAILDNAGRRLQRARSLAERNLLAQSELDDARDGLAQARLTVTNRQRALDEHPARLKSLQAQLARARASLLAAERDARRSRVVAPFEGVVTRIEAAPGDQVGSQAALLSLYPTRGLELRARVPNRYQGVILEALRDGRLLTASVPEYRARLLLERLAGESDPAGTEAIMTLLEGSTLLRPGSMLSVLLHLPAEPETLAVPYSAIYGNDVLYLMTASGRLRRLEVTTLGETLGPAGERWLLVHSPVLEEGQRVVITHLPNAVGGLKVVDTLSSDVVERQAGDAGEALP